MEEQEQVYYMELVTDKLKDLADKVRPLKKED